MSLSAIYLAVGRLLGRKVWHASNASTKAIVDGSLLCRIFPGNLALTPFATRLAVAISLICSFLYGCCPVKI